MFIALSVSFLIQLFWENIRLDDDKRNIWQTKIPEKASTQMSNKLYRLKFYEHIFMRVVYFVQYFVDIAVHV